MRAPLLLLGLTLACRPTPPAGPAVEQVVESFYADHFVRPYYGVPDSTRLAGIRPYLSDSLARLLAAADAERAADLARAPEEKPSWSEGDVFTSLFEGPSTFYVRPAIRDGGVVKVPVVFQHGTVTDSVTTVWVDTAIVVEQGGRPVIADIRFGGTWAFGQKGSLVAVLGR